MANIKKKPAKSQIRLWGNPAEGQVSVRDLKLDAIFKEAALSFRWNGYHGTSLEDVARRLGVAKATLYYYFSNKQELFFQCHIAAADQAIASVAKDGADGLERLRSSMERYTASIIGPDSYSVVILEERSLTEKQLEVVIGKRDEFERRLQRIIVEGQNDGSIIRCSPKFAVFSALGATNWVTKWYRPGGRWAVQEIADAMSFLVARSLAVHPEKLSVDSPVLVDCMERHGSAP